MTFQPQEGAEPIKGYTLIDRLGSGGYGEVWRCTAPGGLEKAVKFVHGDLGDARTTQEFRSLSRIKSVRHPFLLSIERFEFVDNKLVIVAELADGDVKDRFEQCRADGLQGIPRDELLRHVGDAADALDYMCETYGLQHLDIKPQNLLLIGGRVKIADFGLVKDLEGKQGVTATGGVTPIYAPPEAFDGRVSRNSDQYSLAIVYQELLTGIRPFPGRTALQLAIQHARSKPMLDPLPPRERDVIARALEKDPDARFESCTAMVAQLRFGSEGRVAVTVPPERTEGSALPAPPTPRMPASDPPSDSGLLDAATEAGPSPGKAAALDGPQHDTDRDGPRLSDDFDEGATPSGSGRPTLVIGVGGVASLALRRLRLRWGTRCGRLSEIPIFRVLALDCDRAALRTVTGDAPDLFATEEVVPLPLHLPDDYRDRGDVIRSWMHRRFFYNIPHSLLTEKQRPLGRLALVDNADAVRERIRATLREMVSADAVKLSCRETGMHLREKLPQVYVVSSLTGGTGGGAFLDLAFIVRQVLQELGLHDVPVNGILTHSASPRVGEKEIGLANGYAAMLELQHFARSDQPYPGSKHGSIPSFPPEQGPFDNTYVVHLGEGLDDRALDEATDPIAEYLYLDSVTGSGRFFEHYRQATKAPAGPGAEPRVGTFGMYRVIFPRHELAGVAGRLLAERVAQSWYRPLSQIEEDRVELLAREQSHSLRLDPASVLRDMEVAANEFFDGKQDQYARRMLITSPLGRCAELDRESLASIAETVLLRFDERFGTGGSTGEFHALSQAPLERALNQRAHELLAERGRAGLEWVIRFVEQPGKRVPAARRAASWFREYFELAIERTKQQIAELARERARLRQQILEARYEKPTKRRSWFAFGSSAIDRETVENAFVAYSHVRVQEVVLEMVRLVLLEVEKEIVQFLSELDSFQRMLQEMADRLHAWLEHDITQYAYANPLSATLQLLPGSGETLQACAEALAAGFSDEFCLRADAAFQNELDGRGGIYALVSASSEQAALFEQQLHDHTRRLCLEQMADVDAAGLFLEAEDHRDQVQALLAYLSAAQPKLSTAGGWQHLLMLFPPTEEGRILRAALDETSLSVPSTVLASEGDIVLVCEAAHLPLMGIADSLVGGVEDYAQLAPRLVTRIDVLWASPTARPVALAHS